MTSVEAASTVRRAVGALGRRLRAERPANSLSATKLSVLGQLYRRGSLGAAELAELERIQPQSLTRVLAELVEAGLISRRADAKDGRRQLLDVSAEGRAILTGDMQKRDAWLAKAMAKELSVTEQELLRLAAQLLERLADVN
jgi:DNA-binding MarR family transcriptional regulator